MDQIHPAITDAEDAMLAKYAAEIRGRVTTLTLTADEMIVAEWTCDTWDDGVPVTKTFLRNGERRFKLKKGTVLKGVAYDYNIREISLAVTSFDFIRDGVWYRMEDAVLPNLVLA